VGEIEMVDGTSEGRTYDGRWSVGNRVQGIEPGDRAYLLRQGTHGRGLVAIGDITSEPFTDDSWRDEGRTAQYVYVTWLEAIPLEQRVDIHDLMAAIPALKWDNIYSSGRDITEHGAALEGLWFGQVTEAAPLPPVVQGAGFGTAEQNRKLEKAAVQHVTDAYEAEGYQVTSVEAARCGLGPHGRSRQRGDPPGGEGSRQLTGPVLPYGERAQGRTGGCELASRRRDGCSR
jgi:hypothetical protein